MNKTIKPSAEIRSAEITDGSLFLSLKITCAYDPSVHSPKVTIVFEQGTESRFLPLLVQTYYQNVDLETCTIIAEYKYALNYIFKHPIKNDEVSIKFNLLFGEEYTQELTLSQTGDLKSDDTYAIDFDNKLLIKRVQPYIEEKQPLVVIVIKGIIGGIYYLFVRLLGILLIPWLFVDSLMAYLGFKNGYIKKNNRTFIRYIVDYLRVGFKAITREDIGRRNLKKNFAVFLSKMFKNRRIVENRVTFLSNRRGDLSGNFEGIYDELKGDTSLETVLHLDPNPMHRMSFKSIYTFARLYSTSAVVIIDDFYELTSFVPKKHDVKLVQVWHACGAFKTFGFSRLGKPGGPKQTNGNHRMYDRAVVSSEEIRRFYAEGFGIPIQNVVATGVPRTDMFFDEAVKREKRREFFERYPKLQDKKIILFAPTFRGNGRLTGHYPMERFNLKRVYEETNGEYAIIVKMHPFAAGEIDIPTEYKDYIIDCSGEDELNDLLFVTDLLITDYSSAVFEASLLSVPMLLYAYDLSEYIATRDFYYEYESFIPGKLASTFDELIASINEGDFETEKIEAFRKKFFDCLDGKSSKRVADMVRGLVKEHYDDKSKIAGYTKYGDVFEDDFDAESEYE